MFDENHNIMVKKLVPLKLTKHLACSIFINHWNNSRSSIARESLVLNTTAALHKGTRWLVVYRGQSSNVADELLQQRGLNQISLLRNQGLLSQNNFFGSHRVCGEQAPVDVATIPKVRVIGVLQKQMEA